MYKKRSEQIHLDDFGQELGVKLNMKNRWVKKAQSIPWDEIEEKYAALFASNVGNVAKPLRLALGALIIQAERNISDEETVLQIMETPALQYFCGLPKYEEEKAPFDASSLVHFRKRLTKEIICDINDFIIKRATCKDDASSSDDDANSGTLIVDASCAPQNIKYPQDIELLNEAREKSEKIIDKLHKQKGGQKPRTYRKKARKDYLATVRKRKKTHKEIRKGTGKQLSYLKRNLGNIERYSQQGFTSNKKDEATLDTLKKLYEQQSYMHKNRVHKVADRIVSISQPYVRPIVRGKARTPVEFGAKLDISVSEGLVRLEHVSFDAYNEATNLKDVITRYREREGHYPKRVLADKIYRNRENLAFCKEHGISLSGPALGRPKKDVAPDKKQEYADICDRVEVERAYSLAKRKYGLGLLRTRLENTSLSVIAISILAMNIAKIFISNFYDKFFTMLRWLLFGMPETRMAIVQ